MMLRKRSLLLLFFVGNLFLIPQFQTDRSYSFTPELHQEWVYLTTEDEKNLSITVKTVINTTLPIKDIEVLEKNNCANYIDVYLCEGRSGIGSIGHARKETTWTYESVFNDSITTRQLAIRTETNGTTELVVGHRKGVFLLIKKPQETSWITYPLREDGFFSTIELIAEDIDPTIPGEEILVIDGSWIEFANFYLFSYTGSWTWERIYDENPYTQDAKIGEFNASHQGTEIISVNQGGYVTLLQKQEGKWKGVRLWEFETYGYFYGLVVADFYPALPGDEFAVRGQSYNPTVGYHEQFIMVFSKKTGSWEPEIILVGDQAANRETISDVIAVNITNSSQKGFIAVDYNGTVWLAYLTNNRWETVKLWQDTGALYAVRALPNSNSIIVGGESAKLTEITISNMVSDKLPTTVNCDSKTLLPSSPTTTTMSTSLSSANITSKIRTTGLLFPGVFLVLVAASFLSFKRKKDSS